MLVPATQKNQSYQEDIHDHYVSSRASWMEEAGGYDPAYSSADRDLIIECVKYFDRACKGGKAKIRYRAISSTNSSLCADKISGRQVLRAVRDNKRVDFQLHMYVNHFFDRTVRVPWYKWETRTFTGVNRFDETPRIYREKVQVKTGKTVPRIRREPAMANLYAVIDLDAGKHYCQTIDDVFAVFGARELPKPKMVVQTGPQSFHVLLNTPRSGMWTPKLLFETARALAGVVPDKSNREAELEMKNFGIDVQYLKMPIELHAIRVPGSLNFKYMENGKYFKVLAQTFSNREPAAKIEIPNKEKVPEEEYQAALRKRRRAEIQSTGCYRIYRGILKGVVPNSLIGDWAEFFAENHTRLKSGSLNISQKRLAKILKVSQPSVSRQLKAMVAAGILKMTIDYTRKIRARSYTRGETLEKSFAASREIKKQKQRKIIWNTPLYDDYDNGRAFEQISKDIRYLYYTGIARDRAINLLVLKDRMRPTIKQRGRKVLSYMYDNYCMKAYHPQPTQELIAYDVIMRYLEGRYEQKQRQGHYNSFGR